jgi:ABC-type dipeptide/oligopeptide/nickel transport system ATPase subunit
LGEIYVDNENEVTYEPPLLELFSDLVKIAEHLSAKIEKFIKQKVSQKPSLPPKFKETELGKKYLKLTGGISAKSIKKLTDLTEEDQARLKELKERLNTESPANKAKKLAKRKRRVDNLILNTINHFKQLSDENCAKIFEMDSQASVKEESAETAARHIFSSAPLDGVGAHVWEQLWEKARIYSENYAYSGEEFPVTQEDSRCVLCQQSLSQEAKDRLQSFEEYVKGELKKEAKEKREEHNKAIDSLYPVKNTEYISTALEAIGIDKEETVAQIKQLYSVLNQRLEKINEATNINELTPIPTSWDLLSDVRDISQAYYAKAEKYQHDAEEDNSEDLKKERKELETKEWLSNQSEAIKEEVNRLNDIKILNEAKKLTNTTALSRKKGILAEKLITDAFVDRFNDELQKLGASWINIELVKSQVEKGRVLHKLQLKNAEQQLPDEILSGGENRIVALAAFLADVTGNNISAPFVFDDPITSLDERFEEAVVKRLVELSQDRQVIVFTHRLS